MVFCAAITGNSMVQVPDSDCDPMTKFAQEEMCNTELCSDDYVWFVGPWEKVRYIYIKILFYTSSTDKLFIKLM